MYVTDEVRTKLDELIKLGLSKKEAISICDREFIVNNNYPLCYTYKGYRVEICTHTSPYRDTDSDQTLWESNIHCPDTMIITVGAYSTKLEAAMMAEKTIKQWN